MKKIINILTSFIFLIVSALFFSCNQPAKPESNSIKVEGGLISGIPDSSGNIYSYKGIPFAAPPVGELRWKEPQPVIPWEGVKKCDAFGASPMQGVPKPFGPWSEEYLIPKQPISEDCLYLNVWTGAKKSDEKRPVIVWIYGGGFVSGGTAVPIYDGEAMAKKGIVFVSVNYRVGIFGFFSHPELTKESGHHASGNYGLLDQIAGLKWVQKNISAFGGDPSNVTIAGQSAGSMSVNCLVASPLCKGLINHAIAESGASFVTGQMGGTMLLAKAEEAGSKLAQDLNATSLNDLRKINADTLFEKAKGMFRPIVDGYVLPQSIAEIFNAGKQNDVPVLTGWNQDDAVIFGKPKTADELKQDIKQQYGADAEKILQYYPASNDDEAAKSQANLSRDNIFGIQNYSWGNVQNEKGKAPIYLYRFTRKLPATGEYAHFGAFHTGEVAYAYNNLNFVHRCPWEAVDYKLADDMSSYWANFAATGNPNGKGLPEWPAYSTKDNMIMILGEHIEAKQLPDKTALDLLIADKK
jgi:para-nitrobenzyl esterase